LPCCSKLVRVSRNNSKNNKQDERNPKSNRQIKHINLHVFLKNY
jgi:hypothetical protein